MTYEDFMAALCLWREGRGSSKQALAGVYNVILNRTRDPGHRWSRSIPGVILQAYQFSSFNSGDPNSIKFPMPPPAGTIPTPDWNAFLDCCAVIEACAALPADPTSGANMYHSFPAGDPHTPSWADPKKHTCDIGAFHFFKL